MLEEVDGTAERSAEAAQRVPDTHLKGQTGDPGCHDVFLMGNQIAQGDNIGLSDADGPYPLE